jgi:23S rRNA G2069 N7-methylase RlmK/C1962 C5-methylase RlmI
MKLTPNAHLLNSSHLATWYRLKSDDGKIIGTAYVNPQTLICARLLSRKLNLKYGVNFFKERLTTALSLRENSLISPTIASFLVKVMAYPV